MDCAFGALAQLYPDKVFAASDGGNTGLTIGGYDKDMVQSSPFGAGAHLSGDWSWVPYMGGVLFCLLVAGFCVFKIVKGVAR